MKIAYFRWESPVSIPDYIAIKKVVGNTTVTQSEGGVWETEQVAERKNYKKNIWIPISRWDFEYRQTALLNKLQSCRV